MRFRSHTIPKATTLEETFVKGNRVFLSDYDQLVHRICKVGKSPIVVVSTYFVYHITYQLRVWSTTKVSRLRTSRTTFGRLGLCGSRPLKKLALEINGSLPMS